MGGFGHRATFESCYYLTDCAGSGVKAYGATASVAAGAEVAGTITKSETELKGLAPTLSNYVQDKDGYDTWSTVTNGYPTISWID